MISKRLLSILLVFIVLGGVAISGALVFRVQTIQVEFKGYNEYVNKAQAEQTAHAAAYQKADKKNILFGLGRTQRNEIIAAIENAEKRIRVSNDIEAKIPNKLYITIRERYAMYYLEHNGKIAIMDAQLRIVETKEINFEDPTRPKLVDISNQFDLITVHQGFTVGNDLMNYCEAESKNHIRSKALTDMFDVFWKENFTEPEIAHIVSSIDFNTHAAKGTMLMEFRHDAINPITEIEIRSFAAGFKEKFNAALFVYQEERNAAARIIVDINFDQGESETGNLVPYGTLYALWLPRSS